MKSKGYLAILLSFIFMVSMVAACGKASPSSSEAPKQQGDSSTVQTDEKTKVDTVNGDVNLQTYPIAKEKITLRVWYPYAQSMGELSDFNDAEFFKWYEEKTNIHIDFIVPAAGTEKDAFQLLFASGDMPDILFTAPEEYSYRGGEDKAINDGYFINVADYLEYAPNYLSWLDAAPDTKRSCYTDSGKMYGMWGLWEPMYEETMADQGLAIRKDFLEKVNKDVPETYEDWYDVLCAFRDELGVEIPFFTSKFGIDVTGDFMAGFGTAPYFYQAEGTAKYGPMDDGYKEYLTMLNKWYSEGLLDKDFPARSNTLGRSADNDVLLNDKVGAMVDWGTRMSDAYVTRGAVNKDFYLVPAPQPTKAGGNITPKFRLITGNNNLSGTAYVFSQDSKYIEEAIRWVDGFYAQDILQNANYGLESEEGRVWYKAADGHRIGDYDFRFSNPDGLSSATVLVKYWVKNPPVRVEAAQIEQGDENKQASHKLWSKYPSEWFYPNRAIMTAEEATEYASLYTDIETYVQECNVKFITGSLALDTYDSYRDTLRQMGIERVLELKQAALDRYLSR